LVVYADLHVLFLYKCLSMICAFRFDLDTR